MFVFSQFCFLYRPGGCICSVATVQQNSSVAPNENGVAARCVLFSLCIHEQAAHVTMRQAGTPYHTSSADNSGRYISPPCCLRTRKGSGCFFPLNKTRRTKTYAYVMNRVTNGQVFHTLFIIAPQPPPLVFGAFFGVPLKLNHATAVRSAVNEYVMLTKSVLAFSHPSLLPDTPFLPFDSRWNLQRRRLPRIQTTTRTSRPRNRRPPQNFPLMTPIYENC